jgi:hypothetical protein
MAARASTALLMHAAVESKLKSIRVVKMKMTRRVGIFPKQRKRLLLFDFLCLISSVHCCACTLTYQTEFARGNEFFEKSIAHVHHDRVTDLHVAVLRMVV